MTTQILATKLYIPAPRSGSVLRPRLIDRLNAGLRGTLTLISAPAGFGKTTLVAEWMGSDNLHVAWLSLDAGDNDPVRFLTYMVAALQTIEPDIGVGLLHVLASPQPPPIDSLLIPLLNELAMVPQAVVLVLDDYHVLDSSAIDAALTFLIDNQPPQMHLVITTREDPRLPLARLRAREQLSEIRAADLRFTTDEASAFLTSAMGLTLAAAEVAALEQRTEGWIAGLQLAALSMQGQQDTGAFIQSFTGSHHFVLDYLMEEVLSHQPPHIQDFLLKTSILERLCGPLCAAMVPDAKDAHATLEHIRQANLFVIPLDHERRWYRYHHLFGDLLRGRLQQYITIAADAGGGTLPDLHRRASRWYQGNGFEVEAFHHAVAAHDIDEAERLMAGGGTPLYMRGAVFPVVNWLTSLPDTIKNDRPALWVAHAWSQMMSNTSFEAIEQALSAAASALQNADPTPAVQDLFGQIASIRATLAVAQHDAETMRREARRALDLLTPDNHAVRLGTTWTLGYAAQLQGDRATARHAYHDILVMSDPDIGSMYTLAALVSLGQVQELDNQLSDAAQTYQRLIDVVGDQPHIIAGEAYLGLARIHYEWNDLAAAEDHAQQGYELTRQAPHIDTSASIQVVLARLRLAAGKLNDATARLNEVEHVVNARDFTQQRAPIADVWVQVLLAQGDITAAEQRTLHASPLSRARVFLAQGDTAAALAVLAPYHNQMRERRWADAQLRASVLLALVHSQQGARETALSQLVAALRMAAAGGFVRLFVDEGKPMQTLLERARSQRIEPHMVDRLLAAFPMTAARAVPDLLDPLSEREIEVLELIAEGLSNQAIADRLYLSLHTVKVHARNIYSKLSVKNRTQAVAQAKALGILAAD